MKRWVVIALVLALVAGAGYAWMRLVPPTASPATADPQQARRAEAFLDLLDQGRYDEALAMGQPALREALAGGKLREVWETLPKQLGERRTRSPVRGETVGGRPVLTSTLQFALVALDARVVLEPDGQISGFRLVPAQQAAAAPPEPVATDRYAETALTIDSAGIGLPATLTLPTGTGPWPAAVLVHGSGPHDRDETIGPNKPFRDLAHGLAEHGIAVLRYDKRTQAAPQTLAGNDFTVDQEVVDDALAAVAALRARPGIDPDRVFVVGHSLGAMLAPRIGERDPRIAGLVLLAAPAMRLEDTVVRQSRYLAGLAGTSGADAQAALAELERQRDTVKQLADRPAGDAPLMLGLPRSYWLDLNAYDPVATARRIRQPLLVLQGAADYQVTPVDDFVLWRNAFDGDARARLVEYPRLNHLFMPAGDPPGPADYAKPGRVEDEVIADIARWIVAAPSGSP